MRSSLLPPDFVSALSTRKAVATDPMIAASNGAFGHAHGTEARAVSLENYKSWVGRFDELSLSDLEGIRTHIAAKALRAPIVLVQFNHHNEGNLQNSIYALQNQLLGGWRALLYFEKACTVASVASAQELARADSRIAVIADPNVLHAFGEAEDHDTVLCAGSIVLREHALHVCVVR